MEVKDQLLRLLRIQELAMAAQAAREVIDKAPARIEEIEARFRERNAEYVAVKDRHDELDKDQRTRSSELTTLEESRKKYMEDLMQVKNQREYSAMLKEIDAVKAQIGAHEEAILKDMEELEKIDVDLKAHAQHIEKERELVSKERTQVETKVVEARARVANCESERARLESELPTTLVDTVRRLENGRQGLFLVRAEDGICQACYVRVRPQAYQEIRLAAAIHCCNSCRRFLYYEPTLKEAVNREQPSTGLPGVGG